MAPKKKKVQPAAPPAKTASAPGAEKIDQSPAPPEAGDGKHALESAPPRTAGKAQAGPDTDRNGHGKRERHAAGESDRGIGFPVVGIGASAGGRPP